MSQLIPTATRDPNAPHELELSVVMPAYNEEANVADTVRRCVTALSGTPGGFEVIVVDDGSKDRTREVLERLESEVPELRVLVQERNRGYGAAIRLGILESRGRLLATIDSDGQFDPADIPRMRTRMVDGIDCVAGYRTAKKDTLPRVVANWGYNLLTKFLVGIDFRDSQCALKVFDGDLIRTIRTEAVGFTFPSEILVKLVNMGYRVIEEPVSHAHRAAGQSNIRFFRTTRIMFIFLLYMRFKVFLYRGRLIEAP